MHQDKSLVSSIHVQETPEGVCYGLPLLLLYLKLLALRTKSRYEELGRDDKLNKDWNDISWLCRLSIRERKRRDRDFDRITEADEQQ